MEHEYQGRLHWWATEVWLRIKEERQRHEQHLDEQSWKRQSKPKLSDDVSLEQWWSNQQHEKLWTRTDREVPEDLWWSYERYPNLTVMAGWIGTDGRQEVPLEESSSYTDWGAIWAFCLDQSRKALGYSKPCSASISFKILTEWWSIECQRIPKCSLIWRLHKYKMKEELWFELIFRFTFHS